MMDVSTRQLLLSSGRQKTSENRPPSTAAGGRGCWCQARAHLSLLPCTRPSSEPSGREQSSSGTRPGWPARWTQTSAVTLGSAPSRTPLSGPVPPHLHPVEDLLVTGHVLQQQPVQLLAQVLGGQRPPGGGSVGARAVPQHKLQLLLGQTRSADQSGEEEREGGRAPHPPAGRRRSGRLLPRAGSPSS